MGAFQVVLTRRAEADLEGIVRFIAQDDPEAALRFGQALADQALALAQPLIARAGSRLPQRPGVLKHLHGEVLILYRIVEGQGKVRVLRFWLGARDRARLRGLEG